MGRIYRYRKGVAWMPYVMAPLGVFFFLLALVSAPRTRVPLDFFALALMVFVGLEMGLVSWLFYRMAAVRVALDEDGIVYAHRDGVRRIPYSEITAVCFPSMGFMGRWLRINHPDGPIRLSVWLDGIGSFVQELCATLDRAGLSERYVATRATAFFKSAVYSDESAARFYRYWRVLLIASLASSIAGGLLLGFGGAGAPWTALYAEGGALWLVLTFSCAELVLFRRFSRRWRNAEGSVIESDDTGERSVMMRALVCGAIVYVLAGLLILGVPFSERGPELRPQAPALVLPGHALALARSEVN